MKTCRVCGAAKPISEFPRAPSNRDGIAKHCKRCASERASRHYYARRGERKCQGCGGLLPFAAKKYCVPCGSEALKKWAAEYQSAWRAANREQCREWARRNYHKDAKANAARLQKYRRENPERVKDWTRRAMKAPSYAAMLLARETELNSTQIPKSLIEAKRAHLLLERELKGIK